MNRFFMSNKMVHVFNRNRSVHITIRSICSEYLTHNNFQENSWWCCKQWSKLHLSVLVIQTNKLNVSHTYYIIYQFFTFNATQFWQITKSAINITCMSYWLTNLSSIVELYTRFLNLWLHIIVMNIYRRTNY